jgi:hypothetical protein
MSSLFKRIFHRCKNHLEKLADLEDIDYWMEDGLLCSRRYHVRLSRCTVCGKVHAKKVLIKPV